MGREGGTRIGPESQDDRCVMSPEQKYKDVEPSLKIKEVDGLELVRKFSEDMETMLRRKVEAVKVLRLCAGVLAPEAWACSLNPPPTPRSPARSSLSHRPCKEEVPGQGERGEGWSVRPALGSNVGGCRCDPQC